MINTSRQIGAGVGAALLPAIVLTASDGSRMAGVGDRSAMHAGAVVAGLAALIAVAHRRQPRKPAGCCP